MASAGRSFHKRVAATLKTQSSTVVTLVQTAYETMQTVGAFVTRLRLSIVRLLPVMQVQAPLFCGSGTIKRPYEI